MTSDIDRGPDGTRGEGDDETNDRDDAWERAIASLDNLDPDGGTPIAGPKDRSDLGNLEGGQHDATTGGSDLGATTGGGDAGAG